MKTYGINRHGFMEFDAEFKATLPAERATGDWFDALILDRVTGLTHAAKQDYICYEDDEIQTYDEETQDLVKSYALHHFFYGSHWCACHRMSSITDNDAIEEDENDHCPRGRFVVVKLWHRSHPDIILFTEDREPTVD